MFSLLLVTFLTLAPHMDQFAKPVLSCPFKYNATAEKYEVDFSLMAPYSPATLSNIDLFVVRADAYQFPAPGQRDPTAVELGQIKRNIQVIFHLHTWLVAVCVYGLHRQV